MNASLQRLRMTSVDLLQIHNLAGVDVMLPLLRKWKDDGKTRYIGISTSNDNQYDALEAIMKREPLDFIQVDYAHRQPRRRRAHPAAGRRTAESPC